MPGQRMPLNSFCRPVSGLKLEVPTLASGSLCFRYLWNYFFPFAPLCCTPAQVHYASVDKIPASGDESGVVLRCPPPVPALSPRYTNAPQPRRAGVYFLGTGGVIPSRATQYMEAACKLNTGLTIHPFAFRTHTHALGRVVSGWKVTTLESVFYLFPGYKWKGVGAYWQKGSPAASDVLSYPGG